MSFLDIMGRKTRRTWAPFYLRGLLDPDERKSLQPMAARLGLPGYDQGQVKTLGRYAASWMLAGGSVRPAPRP